MKKPVLILIGTTIAFLLILTGIFIGRNANRGFIHVEAIISDEENTVTQTDYLREESESFSKDGVININEATSEELQLLPGIGETLAERIISYRIQNGPFRAAEEIMNVNGIGESKFKQIEEFITVGGQP